jgi:hypothetical protein
MEVLTKKHGDFSKIGGFDENHVGLVGLFVPVEQICSYPLLLNYHTLAPSVRTDFPYTLSTVGQFPQQCQAPNL